MNDWSFEVFGQYQDVVLLICLLGLLITLMVVIVRPKKVIRKHVDSKHADDGNEAMLNCPTNVSIPYWNVYDKEFMEFQKAKFDIGQDKRKNISWLDELLRGGLKLFDKKMITLLIKGPPGSGKSTFAMELCYRLAESEKYHSLYVSVDTESTEVKKKFESFGWPRFQEKHMVKVLNKNLKKVPHISVWGSEKVKKKWENLDHVIDEAVDVLESINKTFFLVAKLFRKLNQNKRNLPSLDDIHPEIIVVDSLNIIPVEDRGKAFQRFVNAAKKSENAKLVVFILDGKPGGNINPFWEYMCDNVVELNHKEENDYFTRTLELKKFRYQDHVLGKHQFKILSAYKFPRAKNEEYNYKLQRTHPFRLEGGVFIYPSIHFYLSKYKRVSHTDKHEYDETYPKQFNDFLSGVNEPKGNSMISGFPKGRCTALIGCRGSHKSHLGYLHLLSRISHKVELNGREGNESALIISLRDDEKLTEYTLNSIFRNEFCRFGEAGKRTDLVKEAEETNGKKQLKRNGVENNGEINELYDPEDETIPGCDEIAYLKRTGKLEIVYFPPGYISPEEFVHRILIGVKKLKQTSDHVTVLFNSLDQLAARFPLCAREEIFIPGIIQILTGEGVTSLFISVNETGQPEKQYGLLPMADLILSFRKVKIPDDKYNMIREGNNKLEVCKSDNREEVVVRIDRFAGGKKSGKEGVLQLGGSEYSDGSPNKLNFAVVPAGLDLDDCFQQRTRESQFLGGHSSLSWRK
jgi:KaiC/GvpD/RAD55 family RecA-like ATPase